MLDVTQQCTLDMQKYLTIDLGENVTLDLHGSNVFRRQNNDYSQAYIPNPIIIDDNDDYH